MKLRTSADDTLLKTLAEKAKNSLSEEAPNNLVLTAPEHFQTSGMTLCDATQSLLYEGITSTHIPLPRPASQYNLGMTRACVDELTGNLPSDETIWKSLTSKDFPPRIRSFLWKTMHSAYKCGNYWLNIPAYEQRGLCQVCDGVPETMTHILTECQASGQETIWKLAKELWDMRGLPWTDPKLGTILGCGLSDFHPENKKTRLTGANRLYAILMSESAHLIWKMRCEWKINREGSPTRIHTEDEIEATWERAMNRRLQLERLMTDSTRYGKKALKAKLIEKTWWGVLQDQENLPEDWLKMGAEVLVGRGRHTSRRNRGLT